MRYLNGLQMGYAVIYSTGTRTNTHYNLQLGGETAIMVKDRFVSAYAEPEYTVAVGGSGGAIQQYVYGQNHPGLIDAGVPQYSYPDMVTQTIHVGDCELLERWLDSKVARRPALGVADVGQPDADRGAERLGGDPEPVRAGDAVHADARLDRVHQRLARPLAARAEPALVLADGAGPARLRPGRLRAGRVDALGRPGEHLRHRRDGLRAVAVGQRRRPVRARGAQERRDHAGAVPRPERERRLVEASQDMVQEGCPYVPTACGSAAGRLERAQHAALSGRRRDSCATARGRPEGAARRLPVGDGLPRQARHPGDRLAPLPRAVPRHAQLAPVVRGETAAAELRRRTRRTS